MHAWPDAGLHLRDPCGYCARCNIERSAFDKAAENGFENHIKVCMYVLVCVLGHSLRLTVDGGHREPRHDGYSVTTTCGRTCS